MIFSREVLIGIALALLIAGAVGGFNYWKEYRNKKLDQVATLVYLYEKGEISREEVEERVKDTPYYVYFLAVSGGDPSKVANLLADEDLKSLYLEKSAYQLYELNKKREALSKLNSIHQDSFNYPSLLLLKAQIYEEEKPHEAIEIYKKLQELYPGSYFARISRARLLELTGDTNK